MSNSVIPNPFERRLDIRCILSTSPPPQDHVLPGLLAGTVGMLAGPGCVGMSMFELQVACGKSSKRQVMCTAHVPNSLGTKSVD